MNAGRLQDLLTFQKRVLTLTATEQYAESWVDDFDEWTDADRTSEQNARFTIRYRTAADGTQISAKSHRILYDNCIWNIVSAVHDRKRDSLIIDSDFSELIEVTHLQSTETEYIEALPVLRPRE